MARVILNYSHLLICITPNQFNATLPVMPGKFVTLRYAIRQSWVEYKRGFYREK